MNEIKTYGPICIINLIDQSGKEKVIWDAYSHHIFQYNSPYITYVTFDFHEYWYVFYDDLNEVVLKSKKF